MIYVTGDMHGDLERFKTKEIRRLKKGDTLIVCGDFGFVWDGSERERKTLQWIGKRRFTTLFMKIPLTMWTTGTNTIKISFAPHSLHRSHSMLQP